MCLSVQEVSEIGFSPVPNNQAENPTLGVHSDSPVLEHFLLLLCCIHIENDAICILNYGFSILLYQEITALFKHPLRMTNLPEFM